MRTSRTCLNSYGLNTIFNRTPYTYVARQTLRRETALVFLTARIRRELYCFVCEIYTGSRDSASRIFTTQSNSGTTIVTNNDSATRIEFSKNTFSDTPIRRPIVGTVESVSQRRVVQSSSANELEFLVLRFRKSIRAWHVQTCAIGAKTFFVTIVYETGFFFFFSDINTIPVNRTKLRPNHTRLDTLCVYGV